MNAKRAIALVVIAVLICGCNQSKNPVETFHSKLTPATGAFGWNLGDKLPESAQVETNSDFFSLSHNFTPDKPIQDSDLTYELNLTGNHTIYAITAFGFVHSGDVNIKKDALVQALTEKYGIREHIRNSATMDTYNFGTEDHSVELMISQEGSYPMLSLRYFDRSLRYHASVEDNQRKADAKNSLKEDLKKQGL